ncbi:MAG: hypothetical protein INR71_12965, partial [Terriglobus roseus]|nr:hypothetical protein [Terriglobus roseus]
MSQIPHRNPAQLLQDLRSALHAFLASAQPFALLPLRISSGAIVLGPRQQEQQQQQQQQ